MTSSALAGERRWGSARRGGMTVLGKVSVPKPLNLPSQRLENHGLDPNVEIVPKGTLSWGTRSSSSATNPWGSSADSKANSPSHLSGRPSSGGSGTRPSTAGSDRVNETPGSAWGPNSRPSSASGILSSDQSSLTSLRPHSADTRPSSSHLSRFAEPASDSQGAWGANGTSERLGMVPSKKDDFSLSSGDFPTLGSEKDQCSNINEPKDPGSRNIHGPPSGEAQVKDEMDVAFDRSKRDGSESVGEGLQPNMEKWQAENQQYFNPNMPQHFDAWRGPPMNAPPVWYRGPQGGPPFRPPVGPGGFPIEPFPYYPQIPPAFSNSHPVPPPRGGPRGRHPKSENPYRPELHDAFMHPGMSYRPGFYPPPMAFEGYYGPPRGYCSPNEPDIPFMNMGPNRPVYDRRYSGPSAPGPSDSHVRAGGPAPASKKKSDGVDAFHSGESRMSAKFISKQQGEWDGKEAGNREYMQGALASHPVKAHMTVEKPRKYEWGAEDDDEDDDIYSTANFGGGGNYVQEVVRGKASQSSERPSDDCRDKKLDTMSSSSLISGPKDLESPSSTAKGATTLMRKIEGLNAKVRYSDVRTDFSSSGEEQKRGLDAAISKADTFPRKSGNDAPMGRNSVSEASFTREVVGFRDDRMVHHAAAPMSRRPYHGPSNRSDHGGKGKFSNQPADGRRPLSAEIPNVADTQQDHEVADIHHSSKDERGFITKLQDSISSEEQRAEMREVAKQRALQRQREEEERIRDQKAKALAKLEELNRRTQSGDSSNPVAKNSVPIETFKEKQEGKDVDYTKADIKGDLPSLITELKNEGALVNDEKQKQAVASPITSEVAPVQTSKVNNSAETPPLRQDVVGASIRGKSSSELDEGFGQRNKSTSYKQKQNKTAALNHGSNAVSVDSREGRRSPTNTSVKDREVNVVASSEVSSSNQPYLLNSCNDISQSSVAQQTSTKSSKSSNKPIDAPLVSTVVATGSMHPKTTQEVMMPQGPCLQLSFGTIQVAVNGESGLKMSDQPSSLPREDTHGKVNNQLKPQHTRRMPRSQQVNNKLHTNDAAVWAPVRSQNKVDIPEEATAKVDLKQGPESGSLAKSDNLGQSSSRSKRAEMERYIPKPVAKELAEQVDMQATLSSGGASTLDDNSSVQPVGSATSVDAGSQMESGLGLAKQNKPGKTHGAWRQRGSSEFSHAKNIRQIPSYSSDPIKSSLGDVSRNQSYPESDQLQAVTKTMGERNYSGSKIASLSPDVRATEMHHIPKDAVISGKGKSHSYGGHRKSGNGQNNDTRNVSNAESDRSHVQSPCSDIDQSERAITPKENRATSERASSHWKPKAYAHSVSSQKGSRITGNQGGSEETRANRKDYPLQQRRSSPQHDESNDMDGSQGELVSESKEPGRGQKLTSSKSSNENPLNEIELDVSDTKHVQHVHHFPAGSRRYGNQVNRSGKGHESHGDMSVQGHRQYDRPRQMHYEYQPVGSVDYRKNNFEGQADGTRNAGSRNRGRGYNNSRGGGNFRVPRSEHLQLATD